MMYYYVYDGRRRFVKSLADARDKIIGLLATTPNNMEVKVPLFDDNGRIAEVDYLKELNGRTYFCYQDCRNLKTLRTYYDLGDPRCCLDGIVQMIEIPTMRGKQLLAKDVY